MQTVDGFRVLHQFDLGLRFLLPRPPRAKLDSNGDSEAPPDGGQLQEIAAVDSRQSRVAQGVQERTKTKHCNKQGPDKFRFAHE